MVQYREEAEKLAEDSVIYGLTPDTLNRLSAMLKDIKKDMDLFTLRGVFDIVVELREIYRYLDDAKASMKANSSKTMGGLSFAEGVTNLESNLEDLLVVVQLCKFDEKESVEKKIDDLTKVVNEARKECDLRVDDPSIVPLVERVTNLQRKLADVRYDFRNQWFETTTKPAPVMKPSLNESLYGDL